MSTIPHFADLLQHLLVLLETHRHIFKQERTHKRVMLLVLAELMVFSRHTVTQLLVALGFNEEDWSRWYRLLKQRFPAEAAANVLLAETLAHVGADEVYVVAGDATQTPRSSQRMEGVGWLRNMRLRDQFQRCGRAWQHLLMVADGSYDTLELWKHLPGPQTGRGRPRVYGERAATPQTFWQQRGGWHKLSLLIRGHTRRLQYRVEGPVRAP